MYDSNVRHTSGNILEMVEDKCSYNRPPMVSDIWPIALCHCC